MSYTTRYVHFDDYEEIRISLGLVPGDTATLPNSVIESRMFLPEVESRMAPILDTTCEIIMDDGDPDYDADVADRVKQVIVLWTASRVAEKYLKARQGDRVKSHGVGPMSVSYDTGPEYIQLGQDLFSMALETMSQVCEDGAWAMHNNPFAVVEEWPGAVTTVEGVVI